MENLWPYFEVLAPSVGVGLIFWFAMRAIFRADRNERVAETQIRNERTDAQLGDKSSSDSQDGAEESSGTDSNSPTSAS